MLAVLAMKKRWQNQRKAAGKPDKPNIVMSSAVQVCWEKAARYFEVEEKYVYCTPERYVIDPEETVKLGGREYDWYLCHSWARLILESTRMLRLSMIS
jgi:hypothetical protein